MEKKCDGQCQNCSLMQQTYCSAVRLHSMAQQEQVLLEKIAKLEESITAIEKSLTQKEIALMGAGAEKAAPITTIQ